MRENRRLGIYWITRFSRAERLRQRFVANEPLRRVNECTFGVLALESEPIDPRL